MPEAREQIDARIASLADWRGPRLARLRAQIHQAYQDKLKLTFAQGARLSDPAGLFNASLEGNTRRAIDLSSWSVITQALRGSR
ncbi:hypothetical protein [Pseudomonas sp. DVZ24]|uniref:hypothetical protein n=1 Tax=Pseudomonas sp. DVZ6 TaxID=3050941 RepID=UPI0030825B15